MPMDIDRVKRGVKGTVYVALLLLLMLLFLTSSFFFVPLILPDLAAWIRYFFAVVGSGLLGVGIVLVRLLNRFIDIRVISVRHGALLFWVSWCVPLLSVIAAVACLVAHLCGYELPLDVGGSSGHHRHWDWDDWD
jgi:hypothetical protein